jgi:hypothetical protein
LDIVSDALRVLNLAFSRGGAGVNIP